MKVELHLNGEERSFDFDPALTLADALRYHVGLKSLKCGCERGDCGTCTIWIDEKPIRSCLVLAVEASGHRITTLEGIMKDGELTPLQKKLHGDNAYQCGFCAPGMLMSLTALLNETENENKAPSVEEIKESIAGNLCRCTGYSSIIESVQELVQERQERQEGQKGAENHE